MFEIFNKFVHYVISLIEVIVEVSLKCWWTGILNIVHIKDNKKNTDTSNQFL